MKKILFALMILIAGCGTNYTPTNNYFATVHFKWTESTNSGCQMVWLVDGTRPVTVASPSSVQGNVVLWNNLRVGIHQFTYDCPASSSPVNYSTDLENPVQTLNIDDSCDSPVTINLSVP